jgi:hypothetical protein
LLAINSELYTVTVDVDVLVQLCRECGVAGATQDDDAEHLALRY